MIGCLRTHVRNQPIIAFYFESETVFKFYNREARFDFFKSNIEFLDKCAFQEALSTTVT